MAGITIPLITEFKDVGIKQAMKEFGELETAGEKAQFAIKKAAVPAAAALGAVVAVIGASVKAAIEDEAAQASLARQIESSTGATAKQIEGVEQYISSLGRSVAVSDDQARPAFQALVVATKDLTIAQDLMNLAIDVSAATGKDLTSVTDALAKAYAGNMRGLQTLSPELKLMIKDGADLTEVMGVLNTNFGGAGEAAANTAAGGMKKLGIAFGETKESIGTAFLPIFEKLLPVVEKFAAWAERNPTLLAAVTAAIGILAISILAVNAAMMLNPAIAVTAAIVALGVAIVVAYKKFEGFRNVVDTVFNAVKAAINFGIDGIKAYVAYVKFALGVATDVFQFFRNDVWGIIKQIVTGVKSIMEGVVNALIAPFKAAFNGIARAWNNTIGKFSFTVPSWVPGIGGSGFSMPDIPYLADGGIVTGPTLAMIGEKGPEAVIPLSGRNAGAGGTTYVTINTGADPQAVVRALQNYNRTIGAVPLNTRAF
jgi:phage-related protein